MLVSQARIDANRRNAAKSTGPKTAEGKAVSRANALKHGLCSSMVMPEDARAVDERSRDFFDTLRPQNHFHCWLVSEIALLSIKIDRCERMDRRVRDKIAIKAELCWDDDKRLEAELLGEQLGNRPAVVVEQLRRTPQGCEWLMTRWALLAYAAENKQAWTPNQTTLAYDLMATPADFRDAKHPGIAIDFQGKVLDAAECPVAMARREIDALETRRDLMRELDEINQSLAQADLYDDADPELKRLRKQEGTLHSRLRWCLRQLQEEAPPREVPRWLKQTWLGNNPPEPRIKTEPEPEPEANPVAPPSTVMNLQPTLPEPIPLVEPPVVHESHGGHKLPNTYLPFSLEPDEFPQPGESVDLPKIIANRKQKRLRRAEELREDRRRKIKDLRS